MICQLSCKKYINETPIDSTNDANFWTSKASAEQAVAGAYLSLRNAVENGNVYWIFNNLTGEELTTTAWNYATFIPGSPKQYSYAPYIPVGDWSYFYKVVNQCNLILGRVPAMPLGLFDNDSTERNQYLGEAHFLRAYAYFYMVRVWGSPVLFNELLSDPSKAPQLPRSPDDTVLNSCIKDLQVAVTQLPVTPPGGGPQRAGRYAAYSLLAHIYAWQRDYANAAKACDAVLNAHAYTLEDMSKYLRIWQGGDPESIFELNMLYSSGPSEASLTNNNNDVHGIFSVFLEPPFVNGDAQSGALYTTNPDLINKIYDTTKDKRYKTCFAMSDNGNQLVIKYTNVQYVSGGDPTQGFYVNNNLVIFRLADIMLLQAEAQANLGNSPVAVTLVDSIRHRAGVRDYNAATDGDLYKFVIDERTRELYAEGSRYYDLIRSGFLPSEIPVFTSDRMAQKGYLWPIDINTMKQTDPLLTQNPWWASH